MKIIEDKVTLNELREMAHSGFGNMVKAVVDIERGVMALDAELHADEESLLLSNGSRQEALWGINIYPDMKPEERIEYDSMINLRPTQGNKTRSVERAETRGKIKEIVDRLVEK